MNSAIYLSLLPLALCFFTISCNGADSMAVGETLTGLQTLTSVNGTFKLGFININNTGNWYVAIWYAQTPDRTIAWVDNSGSLNLTDAGSLVLSYGDSVIWSSNGNKEASSAALTDAGNLIVYGAENQGEITWQSFDSPGNTWLPGMKMSVSKKLTAWKSPWDPSPGQYNLQIDPDGYIKFNGYIKFLLTWRSSEPYWDSGVWDGEIFSNVPEMTRNYIYHFTYYIEKDSYKYFKYSVKQTVNILSRFVLTENGNIHVYSFLNATKEWALFLVKPRDQCQVYAICGGYASCRSDSVEICTCVDGFTPADKVTWQAGVWSDGCVRRTALDCGEGGDRTTDGFIVVTGKESPPGAVESTADNCQQECLRNCSCTAYADVGGGTCRQWFGDVVNLKEATVGAAEELFVRVAAADVPIKRTTVVLLLYIDLI